jgi:hypothetical protein
MKLKSFHSWCLSASFALGLLVPEFTSASALVIKREERGEMLFVSKIIYRGGALDARMARESTVEMTSLWNESQGLVSYQGRQYRARFLFSQVLDPRNEYKDSGSCAENFVAIENPSRPGDRSFYGLGGRFGTFYTSDELGRSTTASHEYGHGLGLNHDAFNQKDAEIPGIMFARGTLVQSKFQWNPLAASGAPGGSIKPHHRRVRGEDLAKIDLQGVRFERELGCLGHGSARWVALGELVKPRHIPEAGVLQHEAVRSPEVQEELEAEAHDH